MQYVFLTMEAMIDAAVHVGFPRNIATKLVVQTIKVIRIHFAFELYIIRL
jgi:pyrroline-5-carboxylate reductase